MSPQDRLQFYSAPWLSEILRIVARLCPLAFGQCNHILTQCLCGLDLTWTWLLLDVMEFILSRKHWLGAGTARYKALEDAVQQKHREERRVPELIRSVAE